MKATAALAATNVHYAYGSGVEILSGVDLEVRVGEAVGLVGESGSGKTTLGRLLAGVATPGSGRIERGSRAGPGDIQMIFQDPYAALNPRMTPLTCVREVFRVRRHCDRKEATTQALALLKRVGIDAEAARRLPRRLSGGQCQRVSIARALAVEPSVLIADEPTSSLDVSVQAQILNLLRALQQERKLSMVLISHDLDVVKYMADRTYVMLKGAIVESGVTDELYVAPKHHYTQMLVSARSATGGKPNGAL